MPKLDTLRELSGRLGRAHHETLAVRDHANDLLVIGDGRVDVAFRTKPMVADAAKGRPLPDDGLRTRLCPPYA